MKLSRRSARTCVASGRFLWVLLLFGGCQLAGVAPPGSPGGAEAGPVVQPGPISSGEQREAAELYASAQASFVTRHFLETLRLTADLLRDFPASDVSGPALLLSARAESETGSAERADEAAEHYVALLPPGDPRAAGVRLFQAGALQGQPTSQLDRLLRIERPAPAVDVGTALPLVRTLTDSLTLDELELVAEGAPRGGAVAAPVYTRLAVELLARGEEERAIEYANASLGAGATGRDLTLAEGVLRGELPEELRPARSFEIATLMPYGGPPALADYAALVKEGVEVAVALTLGDEYEVTVLVRDDEADPILTGEIIAELEGAGVAGIVGFLQDDVLLSAGESRATGVTLVSPTARSAARAGDGVYSLEGADVQSAASIGVYAASRALQRVAMVYPDTPEAAEEADAFEAVATTYGIPIVGRFPYPEGATDFEAQLRPAQESLRAAEIAALGLTEDDTLFVEMLEPVGLFMPIPAEDVEFVAPQFAHFGLDTLAIEVMGTSGWTDAQALQEVEEYLVTGIVATQPVDAGPGSAGYARFQQAYEAYFQRSLVSTTPALGYDAAMLLLEALRPGRLRPEDVWASFSGLTEVEGATGRFSVIDGRVVRRTQLVRIEGRQLIPIPLG